MMTLLSSKKSWVYGAIYTVLIFAAGVLIGKGLACKLPMGDRPCQYICEYKKGNRGACEYDKSGFNKMKMYDMDKKEEMHEKMQMRMASHLTEALSLTASQQKALQPIMDNHKMAFSVARDKAHAEFDAVRIAFENDINAILTPEQQVLFSEMPKKWKEKSYKKYKKEMYKGGDKKEDDQSKDMM